jgi:hypothetical protein
MMCSDNVLLVDELSVQLCYGRVVKQVEQLVLANPSSPVRRLNRGLYLITSNLDDLVDMDTGGGNEGFKSRK